MSQDSQENDIYQILGTSREEEQRRINVAIKRNNEGYIRTAERNKPAIIKSLVNQIRLLVRTKTQTGK